jgi:hypothetical protein
MSGSALGVVRNLGDHTGRGDGHFRPSQEFKGHRIDVKHFSHHMLLLSLGLIESRLEGGE